MTKNYWMNRNRKRFASWYNGQKAEALEANRLWLEYAEVIARLYFRGYITKEKLKELLA